MSLIPASLRAAAASAVLCAFVCSTYAAAPGGRYVFTSSSVTVQDTKTGLTWQRMNASSMNWSSAKAYCLKASTATALGGTGWRLPTVKELLTLIDASQTIEKRLDRSAFPQTTAQYWSSTASLEDPADAWLVNFDSGNAGTHGNTSMFSVRCVR